MTTFVLAGGCFWCLDSAYSQFKGVLDVTCGYAGGKLDHPSYERVCDGDTDHAEVVSITFDDSVVTSKDILDIFFTLHDPTQLNRQGGDIGTQYRSAMFYETEEQKELFLSAIDGARDLWEGEVVTTLEPLTRFWPAEDYHQDFFAKNPNQGYCVAVVAPKVNKVRAKFAQLLK